MELTKSMKCCVIKILRACMINVCKQNYWKLRICHALRQWPRRKLCINVKSLPRHRREKHSTNLDGFHCSICTYTTKRETSLLDQQRRLHLEPVALDAQTSLKNRAESVVHSERAFTNTDMQCQRI